MGWSWRIGRIAGINLYVHFTFLLLLAWIGFEHYQAHGDLLEAAAGVLFVLTLFGIVVLHELGHALAARRYGIPTRDITLLPIGGVARLERMPDDPWQGFVVALAGPAVNVVLAVGIFGILTLGDGLAPLHHLLRAGGHFLSQLFWINVALAVFNLLPAFPMDGGRALRALLAMRLGRERATDVAATLGKGFAIAIGVIGLVTNPFLVLIAIVVWLGASQERALVHLKSALHGVPVSAAMLTRVGTVSPEQRLEDAAALMLSGGQSQVPVVDHGQAVGVLTRGDV